MSLNTFHRAEILLVCGAIPPAPAEPASTRISAKLKGVQEHSSRVNALRTYTGRTPVVQSNWRHIDISVYDDVCMHKSQGFSGLVSIASILCENSSLYRTPVNTTLSRVMSASCHGNDVSARPGEGGEVIKLHTYSRLSNDTQNRD